jgi:transposase
MIETSVIRVHQHGACITENGRQSMGRSRGGLTSKIHAVVDTNGLPVRLALSAGEAHDNRLAGQLLSRLKSGSILLADCGYDADWINRIKQCRRVATRCDKLAANYLASVQLASIRLWLRTNVSTPWLELRRICGLRENSPATST